MTKRKLAKPVMAWAAVYFENELDILSMRWTRAGTELVCKHYGIKPKRIARVRISEVKR